MTDIRPLTTFDDFAAVFALEKRIWEYTQGDDAVPIPILAVTARRGAILLGAFERGELVGFVYSLPSVFRGRLAQWSHMLGVLPAYRSTGLGRRLKLAQREQALAGGVDLVEWTYDPLLALNAHLNFARLGVVVEEYEENVYGFSTSPLHGTLPTDRFVAQWWIRTPHVAQRIAEARGASTATEPAVGAVAVNALRQVGRWAGPGAVDLAVDAPALLVAIPPAFLQMLAGAPDLAGEWRSVTRTIFTTLLARGYRVVDFLFDRTAGTGRYLLVTGSDPR